MNHRSACLLTVGLGWLVAIAACGDDESAAAAATTSSPSSSASTGTGASGGSSTTSTGTGGMPKTCVDCTAPLYASGGECFDENAACGADAGCQEWSMCNIPCFQASQPDPSCFAVCNQMHAAAASVYEPLLACTCATCASLCTALCSTSGAGGSANGGSAGMGSAGMGGAGMGGDGGN